MDNTILNGSKIRLYNQGNSESGSIQYTDSKLSIKGNSAGSGVLITDGKLHLKSGDSTSSIIYDSNTQGVQFPDGLIIIGSGINSVGIDRYYDTIRLFTNSWVQGDFGIGGDLTVENDAAIYNNLTIGGQLDVSILSVYGISSFYGTITASSGITTSKIIASQDVTTSNILVKDKLYISGSTGTASVYNDNGNVHIDSGITVSNLNIEYTEGVAANIQGRVQFGSGLATGEYSHAQGLSTQATGNSSHAQGSGTTANGTSSHAQGYGTTANGHFSHAQGQSTIASGNYSHAEGRGTTTSISYQHATGKYNAVDNNAIFIVGTGSSVGSRANGFWVTLTGQANAGLGFSSSGYLKIGGQSTLSNVVANSMSVRLLEVSSGGAGKYYQQIGEQPDVFLIKDAPNDTNVVNIDSDNKLVVFDSTGHNYNVGIRVDNPVYPLEVLDVIAVTNSYFGMVTLGLDQVNGEVGVTDHRGNVIAVKYQDTFMYGGLWEQPHLITQNGSLRSATYAPGFRGNGWSISKSTVPSTRYTAVFDDLWVRGSLNVYQMVINQIRSTNGSLWISDASKAISASYSSATNTLILSFQTGSLVPFIAGDILRSKRWGLSGSTTQSQWDITTTVSSVNYASGYVTLSAPTINNLYTVTGSANGTWTQLAERLSNSGSQWVRVGNIGSNLDRRGSIYITSTDLGGPFLDVYDLVTSSVQATGGISGSVNQTKTKVRLGQLSGIYDSSFGGNLSGYGLYADNVYLKGTISATAGTFSGKVTANQGTIGGWNIGENRLYSNNITISSIADAERISIDAEYAGYPGIYFGYSQGSRAFSLVNSYNRGLLWLNDTLEISSSNFKLDSSGNISASNVILGGTIRADAGYLGGSTGWTINATNITSSGIELLGGVSPAIKIGALNYGSSGIWMGKGDKYSMSLYNDTNNYFKWNGANLEIKAGNFTLSTTGNISASNAILGGQIRANSGYFVGTVTANTGYIGGASGWQIKTGQITTSGIKLLSGTTPYIGIGTTTYAGNGIWLGKGNYYSASFWNTSLARGLQWNGESLLISASNFKLDANGTISANNAIISGSISSSAGQIGGWSIGQNTLTQQNSIVLGSSSAIGTNDVFIGSQNGSPYFQLGSKFKYTNSNIVMSGSISSSAGQIGGWTINSGGISANSDYGLVSITRSGKSKVVLTDQTGNFTFSANNNYLYSNKDSGFSQQKIKDDWTFYDGVSTGSVGQNELVVNIQQIDPYFHSLLTVTYSGLTIGKQYSTQIKINPDSILVDGVPPQSQRGNMFKSPSYIWSFISSNTLNFDQDDEAIYTNELFNLESTGLNTLVFTASNSTMYLKMMYTLRHLDSAQHTTSITFSGYRIDTFNQYTELSQKGLLVFNSPNNYLQLSSQNSSTTNSSIASIANITSQTIQTNRLKVNGGVIGHIPFITQIQKTFPSGTQVITEQDILQSMNLSNQGYGVYKTPAVTSYQLGYGRYLIEPMMAVQIVTDSVNINRISSLELSPNTLYTTYSVVITGRLFII